MAGPKEMTFEPESIERSTPEGRAQRSQKGAFQVKRHLEEAIKGFDIKKFMKDFVDPLVVAFNAEAQPAGLPLLDKKIIIQILQTAEYSHQPPKAFFVKHRTMLQSRLFPGDSVKAALAYDRLLDSITKRWGESALLKSGPVSGGVAHELGHVRTVQRDPKVPAAAYGPLGKGRESRPPIENVVNEAVASWRGFRDAWKIWGRFGIPRKAWGAWFGFPTYLQGMSKIDIDQLLGRLKKMESKYPGITNQARKAIYEYSQYIEPVMYNIPGADWTPTEKVALKRFLKSRGGTYKETLPVDENKQLEHLRQQPYVKAPTTTQPTSAVANFLPPLSKRAWPPLSCR